MTAARSFSCWQWRSWRSLAPAAFSVHEDRGDSLHVVAALSFEVDAGADAGVDVGNPRDARVAGPLHAVVAEMGVVAQLRAAAPRFKSTSPRWASGP
ncbi:MAG: hypothetical protein ACI9KE_004819 [Polyangiales bacterium]